MKTIKAIYGPEPMRSGELPIAHVVGFDGVTNITEIVQSFGDYGICWFCIWAGKEEIARENAKYISQVAFAREEPAA